MRLLSATVRSYRIHRELNINFDEARTLIGGPNESGKSTLIEAIHFGLFLKATVTGEARASMESTLFAGHPEVEVHFEAHGAEYHLVKRFAGPGGTTRLLQVGGQTWHGEEAQSQLSALLGVSEPGGGRGILGRVSQQWSHLWVWQGMSGDDPSEHVASQNAGLLQQLQQAGGAVAMQSELDGRVASRFSQARSQIFTLAGGLKRGSELDKAQAEVGQAGADRAGASERVDRLHQAVQDFEEASSTIERTASDLEEIDSQRKVVKEKISEAEELRRLEKNRASAADRAGEKLTLVEGVEKNIAELRESTDVVQTSLEPMEEEQGRLESKLSDVRRMKGEAEQAYDRALERTRDVRLRRELAAAQVNRFHKETRCQDLETRLKHVDRLQKDIDHIHGQIAQLAPIGQESLDVLKGLENRLAQASAALNAMATEVEVVAADRPVRFGEVVLSVGEGHTVSDPTEMTIGDSIRLRIHPGGGDSLAEAREQVRTLREDLRRSLDHYGLESIARATEMVARRADLQSKEDAAEAALREWDAGGLVEACKVAEAEFTASAAEVQRRQDQAVDAEQPSTLADATVWLDRGEDALHSVELEETASKTTLDTLRQQLADLEREFNDACDVIGVEKQELMRFSAQLDLLIGNHGTDEIRARLLDEARRAKDELETQLAGTRTALEGLQPDLLEADRERLRRAWDETERQRQDAQTRRAISQATLRSDGTDDPNAALVQAEAQLMSTTERLGVVSRKVRAIALVDDLFQQEQRALADQFSRPLALKISGYLQCLFGPDAQAVVSFEDNSFKSIQLVRSLQGGATSFDSLSGGTREQVAAAVRLAIAELLAADHEGSLPVAFDDSFAYSDPERVRTLQRMLDLGASRGLQIIVLTCNPSDYAALGACQVILN